MPQSRVPPRPSFALLPSPCRHVQGLSRPGPLCPPLPSFALLPALLCPASSAALVVHVRGAGEGKDRGPAGRCRQSCGATMLPPSTPLPRARMCPCSLRNPQQVSRQRHMRSQRPALRRGQVCLPSRMLSPRACMLFAHAHVCAGAHSQDAYARERARTQPVRT